MSDHQPSDQYRHVLDVLNAERENGTPGFFVGYLTFWTVWMLLAVPFGMIMMYATEGKEWLNDWQRHVLGFGIFLGAIGLFPSFLGGRFVSTASPTIGRSSGRMALGMLLVGGGLVGFGAFLICCWPAITLLNVIGGIVAFVGLFCGSILGAMKGVSPKHFARDVEAADPPNDKPALRVMFTVLELLIVVSIVGVSFAFFRNAPLEIILVGCGVWCVCRPAVELLFNRFDWNSAARAIIGALLLAVGIALSL